MCKHNQHRDTKKLENRVLIREFSWEGKDTNRNETPMNKCAKKMKTSTCERVVAQQKKLTRGMMIVFNFTILVQHHEQRFAIVD